MLPYNASECVTLADSRFLFCDNNISYAFFEVKFSAKGELAALAISDSASPSRCLAPHVVAQVSTSICSGEMTPHTQKVASRLNGP